MVQDGQDEGRMGRERGHVEAAKRGGNQAVSKGWMRAS